MNDIAKGQIKARLPLLEFVTNTAHVSFNRSGDKYVCKCPLPNHADSTPSFFVYDSTNSFTCFGCQASGDIFEFYMAYTGCDFFTAKQELADRAGVELWQDPKETEERNRKKRLTEVLAICQIYWQTQLRGNPVAGRYLTIERGLTASTIGEWGLGFSPADDAMFLPYMKKQGVTVKELEDAGVVRGKYQVFSNRIVYPIYNEAGVLVSFAGRILPGANTTEPKYLNGPKTLLFNKSTVLFGFNRARSEAKRTGRIVVVEGYQDVITSHQTGQRNVVAVMGTALTPEHMKMLTPVVNSITLALDPDEAGFGATKRITNKLELDQLNVNIATLPDGLDPDELALQGKWAAVLEEALPIDKYYIESAIARCDMTSYEAKQTLVRELKQLFATLKLSPIRYAHYTGLASRLLNIPEDTFVRMVESRGSKSKVTPQETEIEDVAILTDYEDLLMAYMCGYANVSLFGRFVMQSGKLPMPDEFNSHANKIIYDALVGVMLDPDARMSFKLMGELVGDKAAQTKLELYKRFVAQHEYLETDDAIVATWLNLYERMTEYKLSEFILNAKTDDESWVAIDNLLVKRREMHG